MNICKDYTGIWSTLLELLGGDKALTETEGGPQWESTLGNRGVHINVWEAARWTDANWADMAVFLDALMCGHEDKALDLWPSMLRRVNAYTLPIVGRGFVEEWSGSSPGGNWLYNAHEFNVIEVKPGWGLMQKPVTVAQWLAFCDAVGRDPEPQRTKGQPLDWPVTCVNAEDCLAFAKWVSEVTGHRFDLPTEPEWRQAAAHPNGGEYPWGAAEPTAHLAVYGRDDGPRSVGSCPKGAGVYGHLDLAGNVWEWCWAEGRANNGVEGPFGSSVDPSPISNEASAIATGPTASNCTTGTGTTDSGSGGSDDSSPFGSRASGGGPSTALSQPHSTGTGDQWKPTMKDSGSGGSDDGFPFSPSGAAGQFLESGSTMPSTGGTQCASTPHVFATTGSGSGGSDDKAPFGAKGGDGKLHHSETGSRVGSAQAQTQPTSAMTKGSDCEGENSRPFEGPGGVGTPSKNSSFIAGASETPGMQRTKTACPAVMPDSDCLFELLGGAWATDRYRLIQKWRVYGGNIGFLLDGVDSTMSSDGLRLCLRRSYEPS